MNSSVDKKHDMRNWILHGYSPVMGFRVIRMISLSIVVMILVFSKISPAAAQCEPTENQVAYFSDSNFRGRCVVQEIGEYPTSSTIGLPNDRISSIKIGVNVQSLVCEHTFFAGRCEFFTGNDSNLGNNPIGHDRISSVKVQAHGAECTAVPRPQQGYAQIAIYNCHSENRTIRLWTRDITAGTPFEERGSQSVNWSEGSCPPPGTSPFVLPLTDRHLFEFVAVDPGSSTCGGQNDPQVSSCRRSTFTQPFLGDINGLTFPTTVN